MKTIDDIADKYVSEVTMAYRRMEIEVDKLIKKNPDDADKILYELGRSVGSDVVMQLSEDLRVRRPIE